MIFRPRGWILIFGGHNNWAPSLTWTLFLSKLKQVLPFSDPEKRDRSLSGCGLDSRSRTHASCCVCGFARIAKNPMWTTLNWNLSFSAAFFFLAHFMPRKLRICARHMANTICSFWSSKFFCGTSPCLALNFSQLWCNLKQGHYKTAEEKSVIVMEKLRVNKEKNRIRMCLKLKFSWFLFLLKKRKITHLIFEMNFWEQKCTGLESKLGFPQVFAKPFQTNSGHQISIGWSRHQRSLVLFILACHCKDTTVDNKVLASCLFNSWKTNTPAQVFY